ncbi:MAG: hypothetical protein QOH90_2392, partial [Actinomycetota bacterium]|nr:hypothetical protein [Actinomycetota bacterium]
PSVTPTPTPTPTPSPTIPVPGAASLDVTTTASRVVAQVGSKLGYKVHVTNNGSKKLSGITITSIIPSELDVDQVQITDDIEAAQLGSNAGTEDIVWVLKELAPGSSVVLPWTARAVQRGNLRATTTTGVSAPGIAMRAPKVTTYLATAGRRAPVNPAPDIKKKVVTYHTKVLPAEAETDAAVGEAEGAAQPATGDELPFTGSNTQPIILFGLALVFLGSSLLFTPASFDRRKLVVATLVVLTACVSATDSDQASGPETSTTVKTKVKGKRIDKTDGSNNGGQNGGNGNNGGGESPFPDGESTTTTTIPLGTEPTDTTVVAQAPAPTATTIVRQVEFVPVAAKDLPAKPLESRDGDNFITLDWTETQGLVSAASSTRLIADAPVSIQSSLSEKNGSVVVDVELRNVQERSRVIVKGRLIHLVSNGSGTVARLRSDPIDLVLNPNGVAHAHFSYLLPTGAYDLTSSFEADS